MVMGAPQVSSLSPPDQAYLDQLDRLAPELAKHGNDHEPDGPGGPGAEPARGQPRRTGARRGRLRGLLRGRQLVVLVVVGRADRGRHRAGARGGAGRARAVRTTQQYGALSPGWQPSRGELAPRGLPRRTGTHADWDRRVTARPRGAPAPPGPRCSPGKAAVRPSQVVARSAQCCACLAPQARSRGSSSATMPR